MLRDDYIARFNEGVRTGDWSPMLELLTDDASLEFVGISVGPFHGRDAIGEAYRTQPPDDELVLLDGVRYAWAREPRRHAGEVHLAERDGKIAGIRVLYETHPVLDAVRPLVESACDVHIDEARLRDVASWLAYEELPVPPVFLPVRVPAEHVADLVFVASCLNFAFTDFETRVRWEFEGYADADGLHVALWRAGPDLLRGDALAVLTTERLGEILPGLQMLDERAAILRDVGEVLVERWDGRFANALASVSDVDSYLRLLTTEFPRFDDVPFWKLAQLSAWILHIERAVQWPDLERLTAFADYIVPAALRALGVLRYSDELANAIDTWTPIDAGSPWEVELRAATVWACHELCLRVNALRPPELSVVDAQIDARLWLPFHAGPIRHHLTRTIYY